MTGQTNLQAVLNSMQVSCDDLKYGFATTSTATRVDTSEVFGTFQETEGLTIIATKQYFEDEGISFEGPFAKLSIDVHTSLELVGLTAVLATKLAENGISANVVAAFYHDHVFVQYNLRKEAADVLNGLKQGLG